MSLSPFWTDLLLRDFRARSAHEMTQVIAVLPVAAVEQHGPHLPLGVDAMIMDGCIARVAARLPADLDAVFLPTQSIGVSTEHIAFPGTLTLAPETAARLLDDIAASVARAGIRKIVLMNSHGGNSALISRTALELRARSEMLAVTCSWARFGYPEGLFDPQEQLFGIHGGAIETSLMLAFRPDLVDLTQARDFGSVARNMTRDFVWLRADRPAGFGWMAQDLSPAGAIGDATKACADKGAAVAEYWADAFVALLRDVDRFDLTRLRDA